MNPQDLQISALTLELRSKIAALDVATAAGQDELAAQLTSDVENLQQQIDSLQSICPVCPTARATGGEAGPRGCSVGAPEVRQQRVDVLRFGDRQPRQHIAQVGVGIVAVGLGALNQAVERRRGMATALAGDEQPIGSALGHRPNCALDGVVVDLEPPILEIARERRPVIEGVADRFGQWALGRHLRQVRLESLLERGEQRRRAFLA